MSANSPKEGQLESKAESQTGRDADIDRQTKRHPVGETSR